MNVTHESYLQDIQRQFLHQGYQANIGYEGRIGGDNITFSARNGNDFVEIRMDRGGKSILGEYKLSVLSTSEEMIEKLEEENEAARKNTGAFNLEKRRFHKRIHQGLQELKKQYSGLQESYTQHEKSIDESLAQYASAKVPVTSGTSSRKANDKRRYDEVLGVFDFVQPAIGLEFDDGEIHPVFGVAVGGDRMGGLLLYDPIDGQLEAGGYLGFGGFGVGGVEELGTPGEVLGFSEGVASSAEFGGAGDTGGLEDAIATGEAETSCSTDDCLPDLSGCELPELPSCEMPDCDIPDSGCADIGGCD